jgi:hypothetical protein
MLRSSVFAVVAVALAVPAVAREFSDTDRRFRLVAPDGWTTEGPAPQPIALVIASPRKPETRGNCNVAVNPSGMSGKSQAQVNDEADAALNNEAFWKATLASVAFFKSSTIEKWGAREHEGRKIFFVKATSQAEASGQAFTITQVMDLHPTPDTLFGVTCTSLAAGFDREAADFDAIMTSFEPSPGLTVAFRAMPFNPLAARNSAARAGHVTAVTGALRVIGR